MCTAVENIAETLAVQPEQVEQAEKAESEQI